MAITFTPVDSKLRASIDIRSGDTVRVFQKIKDEKGKTRLQAFEGLVVARKHGRESGATFTVRKIASGVGVERIFPLYSPAIDSIEIVRRAKVRRAKLYYIREKTARQIRRKMKGLVDYVPKAEVTAKAAEGGSPDSFAQVDEFREEKQAPTRDGVGVPPSGAEKEQSSGKEKKET